MAPRPAALLVTLLACAAVAGCLADAPTGAETTTSDGENPGPPPRDDTRPTPTQNGGVEGANPNGTDDDAAAPNSPEADDAPHDPGWPALADATIRPGVGVLDVPYPDPASDHLRDNLCTSNFIYQSLDNASLYLGTASHCVDEGFTLGDPVPIFTLDGAVVNGTLAYCSYGAIRNTTECPSNDGMTFNESVNDLALIRIPDDARHLVHPAILHWGGPTTIADPAGLSRGAHLLTYGNSFYRQAADAHDPREGIVWQSQTEVTLAKFLTTSIAGDSGSPVTTGHGEAVGVLKYFGHIPDGPVMNGVSNLAYLLESARAHGVDVELSTWELLQEGALSAGGQAWHKKALKPTSRLP